MRHSLALGSFCVLLVGGATAATPIIHSKLNFPLAFERQGDQSTERYFARGRGYVIGIDGARTTIRILPARGQAGSVVSMEFTGGAQVRPVAGPQLSGKVNYIRGNDPKQWKLGVPTYRQVTYPDVYLGVDVVYYGNQQQLEFDLVLKPGADPRAIRMTFDGARKVSLDSAGQLVLETPSGAIRMPISRVHQETGASSKRSIDGHYVLRSANEVGFEIAAYDRTKSLVIDPTIQYGAMLSGNGALQSVQNNAIALDSSGNIYLTGITYASDFPTTAGAAQPGYDAGYDGFVTKINSSGTALIYSTYLGGALNDFLQSIAVDSAGSAWVTGYTESVDFPILNPYQGTLVGDDDAVLAKLSSIGTLQFSTYLGAGGFAQGNGVAVDSSNNAYVTGYAELPFPTTAGVLLQSTPGPGSSSFVAKFSSAGSIVYSTLLDGNTSAIAADASGNAYLTGSTSSTNFFGDPGGGARTTNAGNGDAFIAKLNPTGTALLYFTFLGGSGSDAGTTIALDSNSPPNAYVGGQTSSTDLNPTAGVVGATLNGLTDGFVAKVNGSGSAFSYITYLGGARSDYVSSLAVELSTGDVYVTGSTGSNNFPLSSPVEGFESNLTALFQTTSGTSWSALDTNIPGEVIMISPDPVTSGTLVTFADTGIYRTTNAGSTWTSQSLASFLGYGNGVSRSPANPNTIYAVNSGNSWLSTDNGVTWSHGGQVGTYTSVIIADPLSPGTAYSYYPDFTGGGLYKTTNTGTTWSFLSGTGLPSIVPIYGLVAAPDGTLYAALNSYGMYESTDQGATWTAINTGLPSPLDLTGGQGQILTVSPSASGNVLYLTSGSAIYKTTNGGASWAAPASLPVTAGFFTAVASSPNNANLVYAVSSQSPALLLSSDGGATWNAATTGLAGCGKRVF